MSESWDIASASPSLRRSLDALAASLVPACHCCPTRLAREPKAGEGVSSIYLQNTNNWRLPPAEACEKHALPRNTAGPDRCAAANPPATGRDMTSKGKQRAARPGQIRLDLEQRSFYRFSMLATQINRSVANAYVKSFGRPANAWKIVTLLGRFGGLSASSINAHTTLDMDKITRIVDSLVEQGLAEREQDKADRRRIVVSLTAKGRRINGQVEDMIASMEHDFLAALRPDEREALYGILDKLQVQAAKIFKRGKPARIARAE
jgi:DNA-binding MarR family transcriptional regulator